MEWYDYLKPKNLIDAVFSSSPGTAPAPVSPAASNGPSTVSRLFQGIGATAGETAAAAIKPLFPMLLITAVVVLGGLYLIQGGKLKWR